CTNFAVGALVRRSPRRIPKQHRVWPIRSDGGWTMKTQVRAGAVLLAGVLAGSVYGVTLTLPQQQQQDSSGQQNQDNKKNKSNSKDAPANQNRQASTLPPNTPPANNPPPSGS